MPDGSILTLESESGFREVEFWYESNSEYNQEPSLQYPIDIIIRNDEGETITTINNDEELEIVEEGCESEEGDWYDEESDSECYIFVFPISFTMPDGSNITISNDDEEGWYALRSWYETNSDYLEEEPSLNYPVDIIIRNEEGEMTITINSDEELDATEENCEG